MDKRFNNLDYNYILQFKIRIIIIIIILRIQKSSTEATVEFYHFWESRKERMAFSHASAEEEA